MGATEVEGGVGAATTTAGSHDETAMAMIATEAPLATTTEGATEVVPALGHPWTIGTIARVQMADPDGTN